MNILYEKSFSVHPQSRFLNNWELSQTINVHSMWRLHPHFRSFSFSLLHKSDTNLSSFSFFYFHTRFYSTFSEFSTYLLHRILMAENKFLRETCSLQTQMINKHLSLQLQTVSNDHKFWNMWEFVSYLNLTV